MSDKCPKCGAAVAFTSGPDSPFSYLCNSQFKPWFRQSELCRANIHIAELTRQVERLREMLKRSQHWKLISDEGTTTMKSWTDAEIDAALDRPAGAASGEGEA